MLESDAERVELAEICTTSRQVTMPTVVDKLDNAVEIAYGAFPDRIYALDSRGVVNTKGWDVTEPRGALDRLLRPAGDAN